jgi:uncharacterized SAM-binding protein YcdF (DUF218 family)
LALVFGLAILAGDIYAYSRVRDDGPADAAIVLGAAIWDDRPSPVFRERINHAVDLYERGAVQALIFTGGVGQGEEYAESEVGRAYAVRAGVPAEVIAIETQSRTTYQNLEQARALVEGRGVGRVLVVSDPLHMRRAVTMARDLGLDAYPSPTPTTRYRSRRTQAWFLLRELYFFSTYLLERFNNSGSFHPQTSEVPVSDVTSVQLEPMARRLECARCPFPTGS